MKNLKFCFFIESGTVCFKVDGSELKLVLIQGTTMYHKKQVTNN